MGKMGAVSSLSEIPVDDDGNPIGGPGGDPFYAIIGMFAVGFLALFLHRPAELSVQLRLDHLPVGAMLHASVTPAASTNTPKPRVRTPLEKCPVSTRSCRLEFHWSLRERPLLPQAHTLDVSLVQGGRVTPVGAVQLAAPRWGDVVRVACRAGAGCETV